MTVTFYRTMEEVPEFTDYSMKGRTYRYMEQEALYTFGYGLSYTDFTYTYAAVSSDTLDGDGIEVKAVVTNTGVLEGTETVQVYVKAEREGTPNAQLKGIRKVTLQAGESREIAVKLPISAFALYDEQAVNRVGRGRYLVSIGGTQPEGRSEKLTGKKAAVLSVTAEEEIVLG